MIDKMREALKLCAAVLAGETLNKGALIRALESAREALADQPAQVEAVATKLETPQFQHFRVSYEDAKRLEALPVGTKLYTVTPAPAVHPAQGEAVELAHLRATEVAYENLKASLICAPPAPAVPGVDALAQFIRSIDGNHSMGAGILAERICEWLAAAPEVKS